MAYRHAASVPGEDLAAGRVLYNCPGAAAFPARLASEIYQRCRVQLHGRGQSGRFQIWDPCCGGGHLLTVIGFLHGHELRRVVGSDRSPQACEFAEKNLALLRPEGLMERLRHIEDLWERYQKQAHKEALQSAQRLLQYPVMQNQALDAACFCADAMDQVWPAKWPPPDMIITDLPYGNLVDWQGFPSDMTDHLPDALARSLSPEGVIAVVSKKQARPRSQLLERLVHFTIGRRRVSLFVHS